jgi:hypothetical protein
MSLQLSKYLDSANMHHAYLFESSDKAIREEIKLFTDKLKQEGYEVLDIAMDSLKMDESAELRKINSTKSVEGKKLFLISANSISLDAQNNLLKVIEEPGINTHFFIIVPDINSLLGTFISRFQVIRIEDSKKGENEVKNFLKLSLSERINFLKNFIKNSEDIAEDGGDSLRSQAHSFLNNLEKTLLDEANGGRELIKYREAIDQIFTARRYLRQAGSSPKNLLESVAMAIP